MVPKKPSKSMMIKNGTILLNFSSIFFDRRMGQEVTVGD